MNLSDDILEELEFYIIPLLRAANNQQDVCRVISLLSNIERDNNEHS